MTRNQKPADKAKENAVKIEGLTPEQAEKARACKTPEDVLALSKEEGYELSCAAMEAISSGAWMHCED